MSNYPIAVQAVSTVTVGASGSVDQQVAVPIIRSNVPFTDVTITVRPFEAASPYQVASYQDGELVESHSYPTTTNKVVAHLSYPGVIFPANLGTNAIPKYFSANKFAPDGLSFYIAITNMSDSQKVFEIYATYRECDSCRFVRVTSVVSI